jgi:ribosomal protein S18 acetylase RimI-like enzyme
MIKKMIRNIIIAISVTGVFGAGLWHYNLQKPTIIYDLNIEQDTAPILDLFAKEAYWLDAQYDVTQDKYRRMLKYGYVNDNPMYPGRLKFKVLRDQGLFVGFTAYYKTAPTVGKVLFVAVNPDMRGKRYGQVLLETAIKELQKMGATTIELVTRTSNLAAQKLYVRVGFKETYRDDGFVAFDYVPR